MYVLHVAATSVLQNETFELMKQLFQLVRENKASISEDLPCLI